jgi:hypothetical protein
MYIGETFNTDKLLPKKRTNYSLIFDVDKTAGPKRFKFASCTKSFVLDPGYCPQGSTDNMKQPPVYFGIHYINDPRWEPDGSQQPNRVMRNTICPTYNIKIEGDLVTTPISNIEEGEELFTGYTVGSGHML